VIEENGGTRHDVSTPRELGKGQEKRICYVCMCEGKIIKFIWAFTYLVVKVASCCWPIHNPTLHVKLNGLTCLPNVRACNDCKCNRD
jgi:hypothetical protein